MREQLHDLSPGQEYAIQFRAINPQGSNSEWSQIVRFTTTNDTVAPGNIANLQFYDSGDSYIATWDKVTVNEDGTAFLDFRYYHIHVTTGSGSADFYTQSNNWELSREQNAGAFGSFETAVTIQVTAVDLTYNESRTPTSATLDPAAPAVPSTPTVGNYIGLLLVNWDGKNNAGGAMPSNLVYCEVHVSTTTGFTPDATTLKGTLTLSEPNYVVSGLTYGTTYYVKLIAVNVLVKKSNPSAQGSGSPQRISGLDISNGQISASQINFTAKDIGGANAYYPASNAARDALTGIKSGDIAYVTGDGYKTYRYDGTTWQPAPEIGQVSGTKILTGTLTSDAVGTNLLIAATANIADGIIDNAKISDLSAAKITAGTISSDVVLAGRFATALTGARVEVNSSGLQKFAADGTTKLVDINGTGTAILTGQYQSDLVGNRRVVIGAGGSVGEVLLYPPSASEYGFIMSFTDSNGKEDVQLGMTTAGLGSSVGSGNSMWNRVTYNSGGWAQYQAVNHDFAFNSTQSGFFIVREDSSNGAYTTTTGRLQIDKTGLSYYGAASGGGNGRFFIDDTNGVRMYDHTGNLNFTVDDADGSNIYLYGRGPFKPSAAIATGNYLRVTAPTDPNVSVLLQLFTGLISGSHYGGLMFYAQDTGVTNPRFEFTLWDDSTHIPLWASAFTVTSDATGKEAITDFSGSALDIVNSLRVREYHRTPGAGMQIGNTKEIGLVVQEAHPSIVVENEKNKGISLYSMGTVAIKSVQELHAYTKTLEARIAQLEGKR